MGIRGRKERGEGDLFFTLGFWEKLGGEQRLGEQSCKEGVLLEIVSFEGIQQLRACTQFGLGGPKGYLWSWVVGETSPVGRVARLVWTG